MKKNKRVHNRILSLFMAVVMVFTSLTFEGLNKEKVYADTDEKYYSVDLGSPVKDGSKITLPKATVSSNSVGGETSPVTSLTVSVSKGSMTTTTAWDYTDAQNTGKQTATWYSAFIGKNADESSEVAQEILRQIKFNYVSGMAIEVTVDGNKFNLPQGVAITGYKPVSEYNNHYYMYITFEQAKAGTNQPYSARPKFVGYWNECYDIAKTYSYMGLKGYLVSITEVGEDKTLDKITNDGAWSGGARIPINPSALDTDSVDDFKFSNGEESLKDIYNYHVGRTKKDGSRDSGVYTYDSTSIGGRSDGRDLSSTMWYWTCGPEAGKMLNNKVDPNATYKDKKTENSRELNKADYEEYKVGKGFESLLTGYCNWHGGEPNDYQTHKEGEWCMFVHYEAGVMHTGSSENVTKGWNDYPCDYYTSSSPEKVKGFFVEFSEYDGGYIDDFDSKKNLKTKLNLDGLVSVDNGANDGEATLAFSIGASNEKASLKINIDDQYFKGDNISCDPATLSGTLMNNTSVSSKYADLCELSSIYYKGTCKDGTTYEPSTTPPWKLGDYVAYVTVSDKNNIVEPVVVEKHFKIKPSHTWDYVISPDGSSISANCMNDDCNCLHHPGKTGETPYTATVVAPNAVYTGAPYDGAKVVGDLLDNSDIKNVTYEFSYKGDPDGLTNYGPSNIAPTDVGDYIIEVIIKVNGEEKGRIYKKFSISNDAMVVNADDVKIPSDGEMHSINVNVTKPTGGYTIKYGTDPDNITLDNKPEYDSGVHDIYFIVTAPNYMSYTGSAKLTISNSPIDSFVKDNTNHEAVYDGTNHVPDINIADVPGGATIKYSLSPDGPFTDTPPTCKNVGDYVIYYEVIPNETSKYLTYKGHTDIKVTPKKVTADCDSNELVYNGENQKPLFTFDGLISGDVCNVLSDGTGKNVGDYIAKLTGVDNPNYELVNADTDKPFKIVPKKIDLKPKNISKAQWTDDPEFTYESEGLIEGDVLSGITYERKPGEEIGDYEITLKEKAGSNPNYIITPKPGKLSITGHTHLVDDKGRPATCLEDGLTDGCHCSDCGTIVKKQEVIPATGHDYSGEWVVTKEPTQNSEGKREKKCKNGCGYKLVETIPALGGDDDSNVDLTKDAEIIPGSPIPDAVFNNSKQELLDAPNIFSDEEKQKILSGVKSRVWMEIKGIDENTIPQNEKLKIIEEATKLIGKNPTLTYFDLSMYKKVGDNDTTRVTDPGRKVSITITIPDELINHDRSMIREYHIIRLHEGEVTCIEGYYNDNTHEFTYETDKFSVYSLGYTDRPAGSQIVEKVGAAIELKKTEYIYTGSPIRPKAKVYFYYQKYKNDGIKNGKESRLTLKENVDYVIKYSNNINEGVGYITVDGIGDFSLHLTKKFTIHKKNAKSLKMSKLPTYCANGKDLSEDIKSHVVVYDGKNIVNPKEYEVLIDGDTTKVGNVTVTVSANANGNYRGQAKKAKTTVSIIGSAAVDLSNAVVTVVSSNKLTYTGKSIKPKVKVTISGNKVPSSFYRVLYTNNVNAGTAYVYVVGKGQGAGVSQKVSFMIKPRDIKKLKIKKIKNVYWREDLSDIIPTVMYGKEYLQKGVDYVIDVPDMLSDEYLAVFNIMDNTKKIPVTMTIKLTGNNPNYADYSKDNSGRKVRFYVTRRNIKECMTMSVIGTYSEDNEGKITPNISLKYVNDELVEGKDYTVTYKVKKNKKNGVVEATAKVKGKGLYTGNASYKWYLYQED